MSRSRSVADRISTSGTATNAANVDTVDTTIELTNAEPSMVAVESTNDGIVRFQKPDDFFGNTAQCYKRTDSVTSLDMTDTNTFYADFNGNTTLSITNVPSKTSGDDIVPIFIHVYQMGNYTVNMPSGWNWLGGTPSPVANKHGRIVATTHNGGTNWYGTYVEME